LKDPETEGRREADAAKRLALWVLGGLVLVGYLARLDHGLGWIGGLIFLAVGAGIFGGLLLFMVFASNFPKKKPDNPSGPVVPGGTAETRGDRSRLEKPPGEVGMSLKGPALARQREADAVGGVMLWVLGGLVLLGFVKSLEPGSERGWLLTLAIFGGLFLLMMVVSNFPKKKPDNPFGSGTPGGTAETRGDRSQRQKPPGI
jgi:hypothetical protein